MRFRETLLCLLVLLTSTTFARADIITNGSFETGNLTGWSFSGIVGVSGDTNYQGIGATGSTPFGPRFVAYGDGDRPGGVIFQDLNTVTGMTYDLSFWYGKFSFSAANPNPTQSLSVSVTNILTGDILGANLLQTTVSDLSGSSNLSNVMDSYHFQITAVGDTTRISFADVSLLTTNADGFLDNVRFVAAVPEPSSLSLVFPLLAFGAFVHRRKRLGTT